MRFLLILFAGMCVLQGLWSPSARAVPEQSVKIGVLAKLGKKTCQAKWQNTAAYLAASLEVPDVQLFCLDFQELPVSVANDELDFTITNPAIYVQLEYNYGATRLATLKNKRSRSAYTRFGGVIFKRADREDLTSVQQLKGKKFMAVAGNSFGGWLVSYRYLKQQGINPENDFSELRFGNRHDTVVKAVLDGEVDAGAVRTDTLERMALEHRIDINDVEVFVNENAERNSVFPFMTTTELYPEWPVAACRNTDKELAGKVAIALLQMPSDSLAAKASQSMGWTIPLDYGAVHRCLKELRVAPYDKFDPVSLKQIYAQYREWIFGLLTCFFLLLGGLAHVLFLNRRLKRTKGELNKENSRNAELILSLKEFKVTLDNINDAVLILTPEASGIGYVNASALTLSGCTLRELSSRHPAELFPEYSVESFATLLQKVAEASDTTIVLTTSFKCKDNKKIPVEVSIELISITATIEHYIIITRDISERIRKDKEKERLQAQLLREQKLASVGQLSAGIAHEINTPVQYIGNNIEFFHDTFNDLLEIAKTYRNMLTTDQTGSSKTASAARKIWNDYDLDYLEKEFPDALEQTREGIDRINGIIGAMKDFAQPARSEKQVVDINTLVKQTLMLAGREPKSVSILEVKLADNIPGVLCNAQEILEVFLIIFINCTQAIAQGREADPNREGCIKLSTACEGEFISISFFDNGFGISPQNVEKIFDPFFTTKEVGKGAGQGLTIAYDIIVNKHNGTIECNSEPGQFTQFKIQLPIGPDT